MAWAQLPHLPNKIYIKNPKLSGFRHLNNVSHHVTVKRQINKLKVHITLTVCNYTFTSRYIKKLPTDKRLDFIPNKDYLK